MWAENIEELTGGQDLRLRMGIGDDFPKGRQLTSFWEEIHKGGSYFTRNDGQNRHDNVLLHGSSISQTMTQFND
jgi:hypothetical protein